MGPKQHGGTNMKILKKGAGILVGIVVLFVVIMFIAMSLFNPPVSATGWIKM
jgi:hypothetical protein